MIQHLIDTHFHLDYYKEHQKIYDGINERKQYTLCMTNSPGVYISCKRIYPETKYLKFALGMGNLQIGSGWQLRGNQDLRKLSRPCGDMAELRAKALRDGWGQIRNDRGHFSGRC